MIYVYLYESIFQDKSIHIIHICKPNNLKVIDDLNSQCLTKTLSKTTFKSYLERVLLLYTIVKILSIKHCKFRKQLYSHIL